MVVICRPGRLNRNSIGASASAIAEYCVLRCGAIWATKVVILLVFHHRESRRGDEEKRRRGEEERRGGDVRPSFSPLHLFTSSPLLSEHEIRRRCESESRRWIG